MGKFKLNDRHIAFANAVAGGMDQYKAYIEHMVPPGRKKPTKATAAANSSGLVKRPEIQVIIKQAQEARANEITGAIARNVGKEFGTVLLTVDELDAFHSAIIQGLVEVEEVVPVYRWEEILDTNGKVVKRVKQANFMRVKRPPNIREKQISVDAIYKRGGHYAPSKLFGAIGKVNDDGEIENVQRMIILSTGERIPLP